MTKVKAVGVTVEEQRLSLWEKVLAAGWQRLPQPVGCNFLYRPDVKVSVRMNFLDKTVRMEEKKECTVEEKKATHHNVKWTVLNESTYDRVEMAEGGLVFSEKQPKAGKE